MILKRGTVDLIAKYLLDITKIMFAGIIFSNVIMKKYFNIYFIIISGAVFFILIFTAIYLKNKEANN